MRNRQCLYNTKYMVLVSNKLVGPTPRSTTPPFIDQIRLGPVHITQFYAYEKVMPCNIMVSGVAYNWTHTWCILSACICNYGTKLVYFSATLYYNDGDQTPLQHSKYRSNLVPTAITNSIFVFLYILKGRKHCGRYPYASTQHRMMFWSS